MINLLVILALIGLNMLIQFVAVNAASQYFVRAIRKESLGRRHLSDNLVLCGVLNILLVAHMCQIGLWAFTFMLCGEFSEFSTAFYHSAVNFASLGYGDIVMSEHWRLLGGVEAAVGVMMFGMSAAVLFAATSKILSLRIRGAEEEVRRSK